MSAYRLSLCEAQHEVFLKPDTLYLFEVEGGCGRCEELASRHTPPMPNAEKDALTIHEKNYERLVQLAIEQEPDWEWTTCISCGADSTHAGVVLLSQAGTLARSGWCDDAFCLEDMRASRPALPCPRPASFRPLMTKERQMPENQPMSAEKDTRLDAASMEDFRNMAAALTRVEALVGEWERVPNGFGQQGPTFRQAATLIRSALDTRVIPPGGDRR